MHALITRNIFDSFNLIIFGVRSTKNELREIGNGISVPLTRSRTFLFRWWHRKSFNDAYEACITNGRLFENLFLLLPNSFSFLPNLSPMNKSSKGNDFSSVFKSIYFAKKGALCQEQSREITPKYWKELCISESKVDEKC
jgi:hypothetical protein